MAKQSLLCRVSPALWKLLELNKTLDLFFTRRMQEPFCVDHRVCIKTLVTEYLLKPYEIQSTSTGGKMIVIRSSAHFTPSFIFPFSPHSSHHCIQLLHFVNIFIHSVTHSFINALAHLFIPSFIHFSNTSNSSYFSHF